MGDVYSVYAKLRFKGNDPTEFCKAFQREIASMSNRATFDTSRGDMNTPFGCFKVLCRGAEDHGDAYVAGFDASYGWGDVMADVFEATAIYLDDGTYIEITPWSSDFSYKITVQDGQVDVNW